MKVLRKLFWYLVAVPILWLLKLFGFKGWQ